MEIEHITTICFACRNTSLNITTSLRPGWKHTISSPGYPDNYPNNVTCLWRIAGQPGYSVALVMKSFEIEPSQNCNSDYILTASSEWQARWRSTGECSILSKDYLSSLSPSQVLSNRKLTYNGYDVMWVKFRSDLTSSFRGFEAEIKLVASRENGNCDNYLQASSGTFTSPKYPSLYAPLVSCTWHIIVPKGLNATLTFTDFSLESTKNSEGECSKDYVEIREGIWGRYGKILGRYCGNDIPPIVASPTNQMWVRFMSDGNSTTVFKGFNAKFSGSSLLLPSVVMCLCLKLLTLSTTTLFSS